jgi:hypothetical protein
MNNRGIDWTKELHDDYTTLLPAEQQGNLSQDITALSPVHSQGTSFQLWLMLPGCAQVTIGRAAFGEIVMGQLIIM